MRRIIRNWRARGRVVLKKHEPPDKRLRLLAKPSFPIRRPEVMCSSDCFLRTVVEIVSKRANLRFEFECCDEMPFMQDEQVPLLRGSEKTRQRNEATAMYHRSVLETVCLDKLRHQNGETVHIFSSRY